MLMKLLEGRVTRRPVLEAKTADLAAFLWKCMQPIEQCTIGNISKNNQSKQKTIKSNDFWRRRLLKK